jgi:aspartate racemase
MQFKEIKMNKIGIIGGMTPESTILYYKILNDLASKQLGTKHSAQVIIHSMDFGLISKLQSAGDWDSLNIIIADAVIDLERAGASCILIGANIMHFCQPFAQRKVSIPIIHIAEATAKAIQDKGLTKVGLLGTKYTMEKDFYTSILQNHNIETIVPNSEDRTIVHDIIYNELAVGIFSESSKQEYLKVIGHLKKEGAEGIILGCTEIPLLIAQKDVSIPVFNTTEIHAEAGFIYAQ